MGEKALGHSIHKMFWHSEDANSRHRRERWGVTGDELRGRMARKLGKALAFIRGWS